MIRWILVNRLIELYDPFSGIGIFRQEEFLKKARNTTARTFIKLDDRKHDYHAGRCQYFAQILTSGRDVEPIEVDNACANGRIYPEPIVLDGHHRLIGAIMAGAKKIRCSYGGRMDLLRYLQGRRKTCPQ
jgi:hypothetical protein